MAYDVAPGAKFPGLGGVGFLNLEPVNFGASNIQAPSVNTSLAKPNMVSTLPVAQAPTNVNQMTPAIATPTLPTIKQQNGNIATAVAGTKGVETQLDVLQQQEKDRAAAAKTEADRISAETASTKNSLTSLFKSTPSQADSRKNAFGDIGVDPASYFTDQKTKIAEIGSLTEDYNKAKAEKDAAIAALQGQGRGIPLDILNNQADEIERRYAPRLSEMSANINAKSAVLQALQGNFHEATSYVNQAVDDATADTKFKVDTLKTFYDINQDSISRLDQNYRDALNNSISMAEKQYAEDKANKKFAADNMIKYPNAGIQMGDSQFDVARKVAAVGGDTSSQIIGSAETGYFNVVKDAGGNVIKTIPITGGGNSDTGPNSSTNFVDIMQQVIDAGGTPQEAAREAAAVSENTGIQVDQKTLNGWTSLAKELKQTAQQAAPIAGETPAETAKKKLAFQRAATFDSPVKANEIVDSIASFLFRE